VRILSVSVWFKEKSGTVASLKNRLVEKPKKFAYVKYKLFHDADIYNDNCGTEPEKDINIFFIILEIKPLPPGINPFAVNKYYYNTALFLSM
jgi:hypothetical protein